MKAKSFSQTVTLLVPLLLAFSPIAGSGGGAWAQGLATVRVEENLRAEPQGVILGRLVPGLDLPVVEVRDQWVQVELEGWIWTQSLMASDRAGFDLSVSQAPRENLRSEPQGSIMARLLEGTLLEEVGQEPGWTRVRRIAWVWAASLDLGEGGRPSASGTPVRTPPEAVDEGWWRSGPGGAAILAGPDGDTLAVTAAGTEVQVLDRQSNWIRVRLEGWSWAPQGEETDSVTSGAVSPATAVEVVGDPGIYRGQVVSWELQFISLEEAERARTDFYEGEPFLLTRTPAPENVFVYVAISRERLREVEGLIPLERIRVVGRIRTGAAALTGSPILDLIEFDRRTP